VSLDVEVNTVVYSLGDGNLVDNGDGTWSLTIPAADALADGTYQVIATDTDLAGNSISDAALDDLIIDTVAQVPPTITSLVTNDTTPVIMGSATLAAG